MSAARKRSAAVRDDGDPATFLEEYFRERGLTGRQDSEASREVHARAESARERFKRLRAETGFGVPGSQSNPDAAATGLDADTLTKEQKYNRRLANNRKSAAASRVYNEVLRKETEFTLKEVADRAKRYEEQIRRMDEQIAEYQAETDTMRTKIVSLEAQIASDSSASTIPDEHTKPPPPPPPAAPPVPLPPTTAPPINVSKPVHQTIDPRPLSLMPGVSVVPRLPVLNSRLPPVPPMVPIPTPVSVIAPTGGSCPSLFGASQGSDDGFGVFNGMLRLSQSQEASSQEEDKATSSKEPASRPQSQSQSQSQDAAPSQSKQNSRRESKPETGLPRMLKPVGSALNTGVLGSQDTPQNLRYSMASQDNDVARFPFGSQAEGRFGSQEGRLQSQEIVKNEDFAVLSQTV